MIVKWLGMNWYLGPPEDAEEATFERWACFGLQILAGSAALLFVAFRLTVILPG